jgi:hypothetical protein
MLTTTSSAVPTKIIVDNPLLPNGTVIQHLHLHRDNVVEGGNGDTASSSRSRQVGKGSVLGRCYECKKSVVDEGTPEASTFLCSDRCGKLVWHKDCVSAKLQSLRGTGVSELRQSCKRCQRVLVFSALVDASTRYTSPNQAARVHQTTTTRGWLLYLLSGGYLLTLFRWLYVLTKFAISMSRWPFLVLYVAPLVLGYVWKVFQYDAAWKEASAYGRDIASFSSYNYTWVDEKTGEVGMYSEGLHYDVGHWLYGMLIIFCGGTVLGGVVLLAYATYRLCLKPYWQRARYTVTARRSD